MLSCKLEDLEERNLVYQLLLGKVDSVYVRETRITLSSCASA